MKKRLSLLLTVVLCLAACGKAHAQRQLPGMRGIQLTSGMADGFYSSAIDSEAGYYIGAAVSTYVRNGNKWVFGTEFLERRYPYREASIPLRQFTGEGGYYLMFLSDPGKTFLFSIGGSAMAGYETVNRSGKLLYDGATIENRDRFVYGGAITLEVEIDLADRVVLLLTGRERILSGSEVSEFHSQFGIGLKYIIN